MYGNIVTINKYTHIPVKFEYRPAWETADDILSNTHIHTTVTDEKLKIGEPSYNEYFKKYVIRNLMKPSKKIDICDILRNTLLRLYLNYTLIIP